jgi:hypothetical protein
MGNPAQETTATELRTTFNPTPSIVNRQPCRRSRTLFRKIPSSAFNQFLHLGNNVWLGRAQRSGEFLLPRSPQRPGPRRAMPPVWSRMCSRALVEHPLRKIPAIRSTGNFWQASSGFRRTIALFIQPGETRLTLTFPGQPNPDGVRPTNRGCGTDRANGGGLRRFVRRQNAHFLTALLKSAMNTSLVCLESIGGCSRVCLTDSLTTGQMFALPDVEVPRGREFRED